jgi:NTP pyrophosphatase (non-canonical NTP hydrolase)
MNLSFASLRAANDTRQPQWETGAEFSLEYLGCALAGEVGEACNIIKKLVRAQLTPKGTRATDEQLASELADCIIYIDLIARKKNINLSEAVISKFNLVSKKFDLGVELIGEE